MSDDREVPIDHLLDISLKLTSSFFHTPDLYSLLVLSLVTITIYSRRHHRIDTPTRINLSIVFLPDLIQSLLSNKIITSAIADELTTECASKKSELPLILKSYIYAAGGLRTKIEIKDEVPIAVNHPRNKCIIM